MTSAALKAMTEGRIRPELLAQITDEVEGVEGVLREQVRSRVRLVSDVNEHTVAAGGKRLRPAFVMLAARATGLEFSPDRARLLGACMEMIHMATLMHDDVIDNANTRRGRETASARFGNTAAILSGDVLLSKSMAILAEDGDLEIIRTTADMVVQMAEGEVRELEVRNDFDLTEDTHMEVLRLKTASFIECCCEVGALVAGASPGVRQALREYGANVGLAFQIIDDLLDYRGDRSKTGKPLATDFREGCATFPLIFLRPSLSEAEGAMARRRFGNTVTEDEIRMVCDWMDTRGAFSMAEARARDHVDAALAAASALPDTPARELLETVAEYVLLRQA